MDERRRAYWRANLRLIAVLLSIWALVSVGGGVLFVEWLNRHPCKSDPDRCTWCGNLNSDGHAIVPFGTENPGHTWLHPECWHGWHQQRRTEGAAAIRDLGIAAPAASSNRSNGASAQKEIS